MDKDDILEMIRQEIREGISVGIEHEVWGNYIRVKLIFNGEVISSDLVSLPESEG